MNLLKLVAYDDPILHNPTLEIKFPLSEADRQTIADMLYSIQPKQLTAAKAPFKSAAGMAANQWGINKRIFLYCPNGSESGDITVIINPSYQAQSILEVPTVAQEPEWEGCFSVPLATGNIQRPTHIRVKYQNENGEVIQQELDGWQARVWQHENDHLNGFLYDDKRTGKCLEKKVFADKRQLDDFYDDIREERKKI